MLGSIFLALGLVLIVEGLAYALAPSLIERMLEVFSTIPESTRRKIGILGMALGGILVWLADFSGVTVTG